MIVTNNPWFDLECIISLLDPSSVTILIIVQVESRGIQNYNLKVCWL